MLSLLFGLTGCGEKVCAGLPLSRITPAETTIAVGQGLTPRYQEGGYCSGDVPTEADYRIVPTRWVTKDTGVVAVGLADRHSNGASAGRCSSLAQR